MKYIDVEQGTPEWHAHRARHWNASDAPAMMGASPYVSRSELIKRIATGIDPEIDPATQARFNEGHRVEEIGRGFADDIIGDEVFPTVGVSDKGKLSASFDGLTIDESIAFECKQWNEKKAADVSNDKIPDCDYWQCVQQLYVSGADKLLYMVTDGIKHRTCWLAREDCDFSVLLAGWEQFEKDVAAYKPEAPKAPVVATPTESLPAVSVQMEGSIAVISNLDLFGEKLKSFIDNIILQPSTDQEFADTEAATKTLKKAEAALTKAEESALAQTTSIEELRRTVGDLRTLARDTRLQLEKIVKQRKEQLKGEIIQQGRDALSAHIDSLNKRIGKPYMPPIQSDFPGVIKGKKTITSIRDSVDTELARVKIAANAIADRIDMNLKTLAQHADSYEFLFSDIRQIVEKDTVDFEALIKTRITEYKEAEDRRRREAEEKERMRKEAEVKAESPPPSHANAPPAAAAIQKAKSAPVAGAGPARPSDDQIIRVLALNYNVHEIKVIEWLMDMDLISATQRMETEFA